jgi:hypothetical protein
VKTKLLALCLGLFQQFATPLTILFTILKLTGIIHWSWFWVAFPLLALFGSIVLFIVLMAGIGFFVILMGD